MAIPGSWNAEENKTETTPPLRTPDESQRWIQGSASTPSVRKEEDGGARGKPRPGPARRGPRKRHLSETLHIQEFGEKADRAEGRVWPRPYDRMELGTCRGRLGTWPRGQVGQGNDSYLWQCVLWQLHQDELTATIRDVVFGPVC